MRQTYCRQRRSEIEVQENEHEPRELVTRFDIERLQLLIVIIGAFPPISIIFIRISMF